MNRVSLRFDAQQFKQQMQSRLMDKVGEIEALGDISQVKDLAALKDQVLAKKFPQLKEWEEKWKDPDIQQGLKQLEQLESIGQVLENPEIEAQLKNLAELEVKKHLTDEEIAKLEQLRAFKQEIEKLQLAR
jgi:hypothetical protein